jgi:hypothetical protein
MATGFREAIMNRRLFLLFVGVIGIAAFSIVGLSATPVSTQIHPQVSNPNAPVRIAIIADHYTLGEKKEFDYDVENFVKFGLLADGFYQTQSGSIDIVSYFEETPAGQASRFGFAIGPGDGNCAVSAPGDILSKLSDAIGTVPVIPTRYVVLANHPYNIGCTDGDWTYVAVDAVGTDVFEHELGHLIGLLRDEWAMPSYAGMTPPPIFGESNCAPPSPDPYWMNNPKFPGARKLPECNLYPEGLVHAFEHCRMGKMNHRNFCLVCLELMRKGFTYVESTPPQSGPTPVASHLPERPAGFRIMNASFATARGNTAVQDKGNPPRPVMRLIVEFAPGREANSGRLEEKRRIFATSVYVPNHRRAGEFLFEISDGKGVREVGVIPDHMLRSRSFQGGPHGTSGVRPVQMFIDVPDANEKNVGTDFRVVVYRIPDTVKETVITKNTWDQLRTSKDHAFVQVAEMKPSSNPK